MSSHHISSSFKGESEYCFYDLVEESILTLLPRHLKTSATTTFHHSDTSVTIYDTCVSPTVGSISLQSSLTFLLAPGAFTPYLLVHCCAHCVFLQLLDQLQRSSLRRLSWVFVLISTERALKFVTLLIRAFLNEDCNISIRSERLN